jgi:hypothetical protein
MPINEELIPTEEPTNCAFVTERVKNVCRVHISLLASPYEIYPSRKILADVVAFKNLLTHRNKIV